VSAQVVEPHTLSQDQFLDEVHSFEFWFQAVEGYLHERPYGISATTDDIEITDREREGLITALCNYCIGETAALEASSGMIGFAPDRHAKIFLATQVADEGRHLEILMHRLRMLGVNDPEDEISRRGNRHLLTFKDRLLDFVDSRDWEASVFAQNVILESVEFTVFRTHAERADPITKEILQGIVKDERRHMGFGENDLGRRLLIAPHVQDRLSHIKRDLDVLVFSTFRETIRELEGPEISYEALEQDYLGAVARLGFTT
jgi:hypothetical protein